MNARSFGVVPGLFVLAFSASAFAQELVLLTPAAGTAQTVSRGIVRQRRVDAPGAARLMSADVRELRLDLFPDVSLRAVRQRLEPTANGMAWFGTVEGYAPSDVVFVQVGSELTGTVYTPFGVFRVGREGTAYVVQQVDLSTDGAVDDAVVPPEEPSASVRELAPALETPDNGALIDLMVVYTREALTGWGTESAARAAIDLMIAETNQAFRNSDIMAAVRLVHQQVVEYEETGDSAADLGRLSNRFDGWLDDVPGLRDRVGADLVVLVTERMTDASGRGYLNGPQSSGLFGYSIVARRATTTGRSFAHELGHNLGAHHDWFVETSPGAFRYSKGYTSVAGRFLDVMAYYSLCSHLRLSCAQALQYSNPRTTRDGYPTGVAEGTKLNCVPGDASQVDCDADAAGTLSRMAAVVARFRQSSRSLMSAGQHLGPNESILSDGGAFRLAYQSDGNLVLYDQRTGAAVWATGTNGTAPGRLLMQNDGNLVLYDGAGVPRWASGTNDTPFGYLLVQNDGNLVIYSPNGPPVWDRFRPPGTLTLLSGRQR